MTPATTVEALWATAQQAQRRFLAHTPVCYRCPQPGYRCPTRQALWRAYETAHNEAAAASRPAAS